MRVAVGDALDAERARPAIVQPSSAQPPGSVAAPVLEHLHVAHRLALAQRDVAVAAAELARERVLDPLVDEQRPVLRHLHVDVGLRAA